MIPQKNRQVKPPQAQFPPWVHFRFLGEIPKHAPSPVSGAFRTPGIRAKRPRDGGFELKTEIPRKFKYTLLP
jgi:hypothetical protein